MQNEPHGDCVICAEHLGPAVFTCLACKNACCHLGCIREWAYRSSTCPICRAELPAALVPPRDPTQKLRALRGTNAVQYVTTDSADTEVFAMVQQSLGLALSIIQPTAAAPDRVNDAIADPFARIDAELVAAARFAAGGVRLASDWL